MIFENSRDARLMVPRWRSVRATVRAGELSAVVRRQPFGKRKQVPVDELATNHMNHIEAEFDARMQAWRSDPCIATAEEIAAAGVLLGRSQDPEIQRAAFLLAKDETALAATRAMVRRIQGKEPEPAEPGIEDRQRIYRVLAERKRQLRLSPRNGLLLADTARLYLMLGQPRKAIDMMTAAGKVLPGNRYVMRAGTRLFLHLGKADDAYRFALRQVVRGDPWQLAAMLVAADVAKKTNDEFRLARRMLQDESLPNFDLGELAATIGTFEMVKGQNKQARDWFKQSLRAPTENVVAQAEWAHSKDISIDVPSQYLDDPSAHEANAWSAYREQRWSESLAHIDAWHLQEPFDVRPPMQASFLAICVTGEYERGIRIAEEGLAANPNNSSLLNNIAVARA